MNQSKLLQGVAAAAALALTAWLFMQWWPEESQTPVPSDAPASDPVAFVQLTSAKQAASDIRAAAATRTTIELTKTVPARFAYDDRLHVAVRAPSDGVLEAVFVKIGDNVAVGQPVAVLQSPAIGEARSEVLRKNAELQLLEANRAQMDNLHRGVTNLVAALRAGDSAEVIQDKLSSETLGQYRGKLLANHSKLQLASQLSLAASGSSGAISGRVTQQRASELQQARAELNGAVEQAIFESQQNLRSSAAGVEAGTRALFIARQQLSSLLGIPIEQAAAVNISPNSSALTRMEIRSPIAGTIERRNFSATERVAAGDELFIAADTTHLWVHADIRESDWAAIRVAEGQTLHVTTPALPNQILTAITYFVGREVDPATGAIPLVAEVENSSGDLRPGLFARVAIPVGQIEDTIAVPRSAVIDLQGKPSVFIATAEGYRPLAIETGESTTELVQVVSGLEEGRDVVVQGAFLLKSELLLEGEE